MNSRISHSTCINKEGLYATNYEYETKEKSPSKRTLGDMTA